MMAAARRITAARSLGSIAAHPGCACFAAVYASSRSSRVACAISVRVSPVQGFRSRFARSLRPLRQRPAMKS